METLSDLKSVKDAPNNYTLEGEDRFIHNYGLFNCKVLKAKQGSEILSIMKRSMPTEEFSDEQVAFMHEMSNKEVLVHICGWPYTTTDIFVYPEDNTPFTVECFI